MRLKVEAVKKICAECKRKAQAQGLPVECEAIGPCDYKFCERVYVYEILEVR